MTDRDKVISGLHCRSQDLIIDLPDCDKCDYQVHLVNRAGCDFRRLCKDAVELLKEQEPVKPKTENDGAPEDIRCWWYVCGNCGRDIDIGYNYCRHCGKKLKWDEDERADH